MRVVPRCLLSEQANQGLQLFYGDSQVQDSVQESGQSLDTLPTISVGESKQRASGGAAGVAQRAGALLKKDVL